MRVPVFVTGRRPYKGPAVKVYIVCRFRSTFAGVFAGCFGQIAVQEHEAEYTGEQ